MNFTVLTGIPSFPSIPVNFKVYNKTTEKFIDFGFLEVDHSGPQPNGWFSSDGGATSR